MLTFKNYNIADWFSFYRVAAAPFLLVLLWIGNREFFTWLLLISYCTDMIDGFLARRLKITSPRGSQLDSFGDQVTLLVGLSGLMVYELEFIQKNYILIIIAFIPYVIQMLLAYWKYGKATAFHTYLAKSSAIIQAVFILWSLFFIPNYSLFYFMIIIGFLETIEEIILIFMIGHWASDIKGIYWAIRDRRLLIKKKEIN
jgi:phosphatidylglycerophosphate synthase